MTEQTVRMFSNRIHSAWTLLTLGAIVACSGSENETPAPEESLEPGMNFAAASAVFKTADYTLAPGEEKYLCYATTFNEAFVAEAVSNAAQPTLHHIVFAKALAPEPEGFSECDVLFRLSWEPLYLSGAGASSLELPVGYGHQIAAGTQVVAQLHLLNASTQPVTDSIEITLRRSTVAQPKPVAAYAFGTFDVNLPPAQPSSLESTCEVKEPVRLLAAFPHMHLLGTRMTLNVSRAGGAFEKVFDRNPFDFDDQHLEALDLTLNAGDQAKTHCEYDNPHDQAITFGESTMNEMCFFVGFAADRDAIGGCVVGTPAGGSSGTE
jgi:hypothetical protein